MQNLNKIFIGIITLALVSSVPIQSSFALQDAIIAIVNDEVITLKDLRDYIRKTYVGLAAQGMSNEQLKVVMNDLEKDGLNKLIEDKLIISRAYDIGIEIREKLIDERLDEIRGNYASNQVFLDALVENGASLTDLRHKIKEQFLIQYVIDHEVRSKIYVNPKEVTNYYDENLNQFQKKERINLKSIFIAFGNNIQDAKNKANAAHQKIIDGADFDTVAKEYSEAPAIGVIEKGQILPVVENVVFQLSINEVSEPLEVENGVYIFRLESKMPAQIAEIKEVKDFIYNYLFQNKFKNKFGHWLKDLKAEAYIEIKQ